MEDKDLYNRLMLLVFGLIVVLLCAGSYSYFSGKKADTDIEGLVKNTKVFVLEETTERDFL